MLARKWRPVVAPIQRSSEPFWGAVMSQRWRIIAVRVLIGVVGVTLLQVLVFRWDDPSMTFFMLADRRADGEPARRHAWVPYDEIAPAMKLAVVAAEDQRFPTHRGFDLEAIADALEEYREGEGLRGGSTISQQVARNLFLWRGGGLVRKGLEAYYTFLIETFWPKRRILEVYLNVAEFGDGIYGVGAASSAFFGKEPAELREREAALLAAVLPSPRRMRPAPPSPYVADRADEILVQMSRLGTGYLSGI